MLSTKANLNSFRILVTSIMALNLVFVLAPPAPAASSSKVIVLIPKQTSDPFFTDTLKGAKEAADALGYTIDYVGPTTADAAGQVTTIETAIQSKPAAITIAPNDPNAVAPALVKAAAAGIVVSTFNADSAPSARQFFISQADDQLIAQGIVDTMAMQVGKSGRFLLVTSTATAANQKLWLSLMYPYMAKKYPRMKIVKVIPGDDNPATVLAVTSSYLAANKKRTTGVWVIGGGMSGAVKAMQQLSIDPKKMIVAGLCIPSDVAAQLKSGLIKNCVLWSPADTGYADIYAIDAKIKGKLPVNGTLSAGRLGVLKVTDSQVSVGKPFTFTAANIDQFHF